MHQMFDRLKAESSLVSLVAAICQSASPSFRTRPPHPRIRSKVEVKRDSGTDDHDRRTSFPSGKRGSISESTASELLGGGVAWPADFTGRANNHQPASIHTIYSVLRPPTILFLHFWVHYSVGYHIHPDSMHMFFKFVGQCVVRKRITTTTNQQLKRGRKEEVRELLTVVLSTRISEHHLIGASNRLTLPGAFPPAASCYLTPISKEPNTAPTRRILMRMPGAKGFRLLHRDVPRACAHKSSSSSIFSELCRNRTRELGPQAWSLLYSSISVYVW